MKAFIIMPFASSYDGAWSSIQKACDKTGIKPVRADEIQEAGPIINQIFRSIEDADLVIAEITDRNPNVYYEVGVSHSLGKLTVLLAQREAIKKLPFDIKHNRAVVYDIGDVEDLEQKLIKQLSFLKDAPKDYTSDPKIDSFFRGLNFKGEASRSSTDVVVDYISKNYNLTDAALVEKKMIKEGLLITVKDAFKEKIRVLVDINGVIKQVKRIT